MIKTHIEKKSKKNIIRPIQSLNGGSYIEIDLHDGNFCLLGSKDFASLEVIFDYEYRWDEITQNVVSVESGSILQNLILETDSVIHFKDGDRKNLIRSNLIKEQEPTLHNNLQDFFQ